MTEKEKLLNNVVFNNGCELKENTRTTTKNINLKITSKIVKCGECNEVVFKKQLRNGTKIYKVIKQNI